MPTESEIQAEPAPELPPLSASDFRTYNHMSVVMESYVNTINISTSFGIDTLVQHSHFRQEWRTLWDACLPKPTSKPPSARALINIGLQFLSHLTIHHDIEEAHIFPMLAKRMPEFQPKGAHVEQHKQMHKGIDELQEYLVQCREGSRDFRREEVREQMQKWGDVLWTHLDEEVKTLSAPNMRKFWSLKEMRQMPM